MLCVTKYTSVNITHILLHEFADVRESALEKLTAKVETQNISRSKLSLYCFVFTAESTYSCLLNNLIAAETRPTHEIDENH